MSDEEKEKNAEAEELEVQEQVQDAPAEEKVAEPSLEEELLKWRDTAMRTAAEYDNYRKRMVKEKEECAKFANQRLLEELAQLGIAEHQVRQIDLPEDKVSGLKIAMKVLDGIDDISICKLTGADVVRHQLVQKIIEAYEVYDKKNPPEPAAKSGPYRRKKQ